LLLGFAAASREADADGDGIPDAFDTDNDNDGIPDADDNCPTVANADQTDTDEDLEGDACDAFPNDRDDDGVSGDVDNCPLVPNFDQADHDGDLQGDVCDPDDDNDGASDVFENSAGTDPFDGTESPEVSVPALDLGARALLLLLILGGTLRRLRRGKPFVRF
jgi:hypothetical protein